MRTTINQVRVELRELQEGHRQLNDFFWGDFLRAIKQKTVRYPLMCCYYTGGTMANNTTPLNLIVIIADRVFKAHENLNDTESDTAQVCRDLKNVMTRSKRWNQIGRFGDAPIEKFIDKGHDEVAGHIMRIPFTLFDTMDICELPLVGYDLEDTTQPSCLPVAITDSDGITIVDVASGGEFVCTPQVPFEPVTGQNSDDTFTFTANSGDNVPLVDIEITTGSGVLTFPSNKDISLSNYYQLILPTGTRVPVNTVTDPTTQVGWYNNTANVTTGTGIVSRTGGTGFGFNARVNFLIPTLGDFKLEFKLIADDVFCGISFVDVTSSYTDIGFCISANGTTYYLYEVGTNIINFGGRSSTDTLRIERVGSNVKYYVNGVLKYTQPLNSSVQFSSGFMVFDSTLAGPGSRIENILLTYL